MDQLYLEVQILNFSKSGLHILRPTYCYGNPSFTQLTHSIGLKTLWAIGSTFSTPTLDSSIELRLLLCNMGHSDCNPSLMCFIQCKLRSRVSKELQCLLQNCNVWRVMLTMARVNNRKTKLEETPVHLSDARDVTSETSERRLSAGLAPLQCGNGLDGVVRPRWV
ncbi:hypothetical protein CsSME_00011396 [Camellia sinensis var. sinensis]